MSRERLVDKIASHLNQIQKKSPVEQLQEDLKKVHDCRVNEVITLKSVGDGIKDSELVAALRSKGTTIEKLANSEGYISLQQLRDLNIHVS